MMIPRKQSIMVAIATIATLLIAPVTSFNINLSAKAKSNVGGKRELLPTPDPTNPERYLPPSSLSPSINKSFYSLPETLVRAGPVSLLTRVTSPDKYEQSILRYMYESQTTDVTTAQGNMDAFFRAPDVWAEQKMLEQRGDREVYDYGKGPTFDRIVLATVWGSFVSGLIGRVLWQLVHGNRNLF
mmetsp:Transcript_32067/g.47167  ORF Transcript_32067/g.47167 Transcript_32067/m.47167 type:complete len:185 (+) Transcript_32067:36-590(+)